MIRIAQSKEDILKCWEVLHLLRPHLKEADFADKVMEMFSEGYQIAFIEENEKAVAAIGFRYLQMLYNGKQIYIDDLSTVEEARGKGFAGKLLDYVVNLAKEKGCQCVTLDSGPARHTAHRLYLNKGFNIDSYHFSKKI
ncbi:Acetyltransferase (GNAT) family protein [Pseudarcicella hirudinis]|uniref:Acetyltransferase (GNAT) family protein n=1 Tax=Pseudarcicella hirudinis TaxID=1079859 RepID=A0A1I5VY84_9BACT|nr:GNAT family N-acetyltransferase [Pseudarcicella hirudinis]SFQ12390.1 Acetyltransferase (GNAT) family protein [Pseudarcicella hirudinis]